MKTTATAVQGNFFEASLTKSVLAVCAGILFISVMARVAIPLPFSPVPLTGQTFGVALTALLLGRKRAVATLLGYLGLGAAGFPVFAGGNFGISLAPTLGYLIGMLAASWVIGGLADRGYSRTFKQAWFACFLGSLCIFGFGLSGLLFFVPKSHLLMAGLIPFIPGDLIKTTLAASVASAANHSRFRSRP